MKLLVLAAALISSLVLVTPTVSEAHSLADAGRGAAIATA